MGLFGKRRVFGVEAYMAEPAGGRENARGDCQEIAIDIEGRRADGDSRMRMRYISVSDEFEVAYPPVNPSPSMAVVAMPVKFTFQRILQLPPVAPARIPEIVKYEARQQIPHDLDDVLWCYRVMPRESDENEIPVLLKSVTKKVAAEYVAGIPLSPKKVRLITAADALHELVGLPERGHDAIWYNGPEATDFTLVIRSALGIYWTRSNCLRAEDARMPDDADMRRQKQVQNLDFALGELRRSLEFYQSQIMGYHSNDLSLNAVHVFLQNNVIGSRDDAVGRLNQLLAREGFGSNVAHADNYPRHAAFGSQHPQPGYEVACGAAMHGLNSDRTDYFTAEPAYRPHGNRGIVKSAMLALAGKLIQWSK